MRSLKRSSMAFQQSTSYWGGLLPAEVTPDLLSRILKPTGRSLLPFLGSSRFACWISRTSIIEHKILQGLTHEETSKRPSVKQGHLISRGFRSKKLVEKWLRFTLYSFGLRRCGCVQPIGS